jgi:hypothetical protein
MAKQMTFQEKKVLAIRVIWDIREDLAITYKEARDMGDGLLGGDDVMKDLLKKIKSMDKAMEALRNLSKSS